MRNILSKVAQSVREVYHRAEDLIEEERDFPISENMLNAALKRYVTDNVDQLSDLHLNLYDDWLQLFATVHYKGIHATLATKLKLIQMQFDRNTQRFVFEQEGGTEIIDIHYDETVKILGVNFHKIGVNVALWWFQSIKKEDPLGYILEKLDVVTVKHGLLYLDLNRWLADIEKVMSTLRKVEVTHAVLRRQKLIVKASVNLAGIFGTDTNTDAGVEPNTAPPINAQRQY
ncbi:MAG: hypothetical protein VXW65_00250 [Pseudomonadota bacterium]|nr:hypothetical protein [Pseudomonadota bacterium]